MNYFKISPSVTGHTNILLALLRTETFNQLIILIYCIIVSISWVMSEISSGNTKQLSIYLLYSELAILIGFILQIFVNAIGKECKVHCIQNNKHNFYLLAFQRKLMVFI